MIALFALLFAAKEPDLATPLAGLEHTRRPGRIETFASGLVRTESRAPAEGIVALRPTPEGRVAIRGGTFVMGSTAAEMIAGLALSTKDPGYRTHQNDYDLSVRAEGREHHVTVTDFVLDRLEVTVERYGRCVAAGACPPPAFTPGDVRYDRPDLPVTHVRWEDARSYCAWVSGRLPTEAEWEYAARGGRANRTFPWGELWNGHLANHGQLADDPTDARDGFLGLAPVGSFRDGATPSGLLDMAGNAAEWVFDYYERDDEGYGYRGAAQTNPKGPPFSQWGHVVRGGSYRSGATWLRTAARTAATDPRRDVGFRCAWDPGGGG